LTLRIRAFDLDDIMTIPPSPPRADPLASPSWLTADDKARLAVTPGFWRLIAEVEPDPMQRDRWLKNAADLEARA
jgi:hypothetical protein